MKIKIGIHLGIEKVGNIFFPWEENQEEIVAQSPSEKKDPEGRGFAGPPWLSQLVDSNTGAVGLGAQTGLVDYQLIDFSL